MSTNEFNFKWAAKSQGILQFLAITLTCILFVSGIIQFGYSFFIALSEESKFTPFVNNILNSFELFFMAPIPFLIIFGHRDNIVEVFRRLLDIERSEVDDIKKFGKTQLDDKKAKKAFVSSIIGILITSVLKFFIDILHDYKKFEIGWQFFAVITSIFLFLIILIYYFNLLSTKHDNEST